jgi:hypothetical protein
MKKIAQKNMKIIFNSCKNVKNVAVPNFDYFGGFGVLSR